MPQPSKSTRTIDGARGVSNWRGRLACDWCGAESDPLDAPEQRSGVSCSICIGDVLRPPPRRTVADIDDIVAIGNKLDEFLKRYKPEPTFCGTGEGRRPRGRPRKNPPAPRPAVKKERKPTVVTRWRYFARTDTLRIVRERKWPFAGIRAIVWGILATGPATVGDVLERCTQAGVPEGQAVPVIRKMVITYRTVRVERAA